jgi:hypothetical protein
MMGASKQNIARLAFISAVALGCMLGADALARIATLELTWFDVGELGAAVVAIAFVPALYRVPVGGITFGLAALAGVARTVNAAAHALLEGRTSPIPRRA